MTQKRKNNVPHVLKITKNQPLPTRLVFFDTESDLIPQANKRTVHRLKIGIAQEYQRDGDFDLELQSECIFENKSQLFGYLKNILTGNQTVYLIAHNIPYDAMIVDAFRELPKLGFELSGLYSKGQVSIIRWKRAGTRLIMLDNGNFFSGTLDAWGNLFDFPKLKIDFQDCTLAELTVYCCQDVEIMVKSWRAWFQFLHEHNCGGFRITVGSTAFNTWRSAHMDDTVYVHKHSPALKLERDSYHGGRVECFYQGTYSDDTYYYVDINNQYGHVMREGSFPLGLQGYSDKLPIRRLIQYLHRYNVIARVTVNVDIPAFMVKVNGHNTYPLGRFTVSLTTEELKLALRNGWLEELHEMSWYRTGEIFRSYIEQFYALRMDYRDANNPGFESICKLLINSLYGKFGQMGFRQEIIGKAPFDEIWTMPVINVSTGVRSRQTAIGGVVYEEFHEGESYHAIPSIAAHVTANARLYLLEMIELAGWENTLYIDTDSMILNQAGYERISGMVAENEIGKLKIEIISDFVTIHAPKEYEMSGRKRLKGVKRDAVEIAPAVFQQEQWPRLAGMIRDGMPEEYATVTIEKHHARKIHSGTVLPSGRIEPFRLG